MITQLSIVGFKRFARQHLELAPLTILTGLNGSGKTSVLHALLLIREAAHVPKGGSVRLNGPYGLELGTAEAVRNWTTETDIEIAIDESQKGRCAWTFSVPGDRAQFLTVTDGPADCPAAFSLEPRAFTYLCAERLGPRNVLGSAALPEAALEIGVRGEFCAQLLAALGGKPIADPARRHPTRDPASSPLVKYETEAWLSEIARPVEVDGSDVAGTPVTTLRFRVPGAEWVAAPNMGFGVTYALPIVLGGLVARSSGLVVVENPEAHLHPAGQSRMGVFLAWLASRGVQVLVETHSDHVLNGIRRAIGEHRYLEAKDAAVHFFPSTTGDADPVHLRFTTTGGVSDWPPSFFDQYQIDVAALGRIRRQR